MSTTTLTSPIEKRLWELLLSDPRNLTEVQEVMLLTHEEMLLTAARNIPQFLADVHRLQTYHARKMELEKLSTEELQKRQDATLRSRAGDDSDYDPMDSPITAPPLDSEESIVRELLQERRAQKSAHWDERIQMAGGRIEGMPFDEGFPDDLKVFRKRGGIGPILWQLLLSSGDLVIATALHPHEDPLVLPSAWVGHITSLPIDYADVAGWRLMELSEHP